MARWPRLLLRCCRRCAAAARCNLAGRNISTNPSPNREPPRLDCSSDARPQHVAARGLLRCDRSPPFAPRRLHQLSSRPSPKTILSTFWSLPAAPSAVPDVQVLLQWLIRLGRKKKARNLPASARHTAVKLLLRLRGRSKVRAARACRCLKTRCARCRNAARSDLTSAPTDCVSASPFGPSLVLPRCCLPRLGLSPSSLLQVRFAANRCRCACNCCCLRLLAMYDTNLRCRIAPTAARCLLRLPFGLQPAAAPGALRPALLRLSPLLLCCASLAAVAVVAPNRSHFCCM